MSHANDGAGAPAQTRPRRRNLAIGPVCSKPRLEENTGRECLSFGQFTRIDCDIVVNMNGHYQVRANLAVRKRLGEREEEARIEESRPHRTSTLRLYGLPFHGRTVFCRRSAIGV